jgi:hypothetical protein
VINREDGMVYQGHDRDTVIDWVPAQGRHALLELMIMLDDGSNTTLGTQRQKPFGTATTGTEVSPIVANVDYTASHAIFEQVHEDRIR